MIERLAAALRNLVTRGKVTSAAIGPRTILAVSGFQGDQFDAVELLLPPGYVANPAPGADVVLLSIGGNRDHKVAIAGDAVGATVANLAPGEIGLRASGQQIVLRIGHIELLADGETLRQLVTDQFMAVFNEHTHAGGAPPTQQMTSAHLTGALHAGGQS